MTQQHRASSHGAIHASPSSCIPHAPRPPAFLIGRQQRRKGNNSDGSDSDTDGYDTSQPPRLTPATMVDRSSSQAGRRPPPQAAAAAAPAAVPAKKSPRDLEKEERERGNAKFGQGDFEGAVKCYTRYGGVPGRTNGITLPRACSRDADTRVERVHPFPPRSYPERMRRMDVSALVDG